MGNTISRDDGSTAGSFVLRKDTDGFEHLVFAEAIIPDTPNVYGDFHTRQSVREFAYGFMIDGFGIDVNHDNVDRSDAAYVVESFIAREGDPDFIVGAWVIGMYIQDDELWQKVLNKEINGFSYEAWVTETQATLVVPDNRTRVGTVEPDPFDGHTHKFFVVLDDNGRPLLGGTSYDQGHSHSINTHTFTGSAFEHSHIYNFKLGKGGL